MSGATAEKGFTSPYTLNSVVSHFIFPLASHISLQDKAQEAARACQNTLKFQFEDAGSTTQKVLRYLDVSLSKLMQKQSEQERQLDDESSHMKSALAEKVQKIVSRK